MKRVTDHLPKSNDQAWARGCSKCKCGIVSGADILPALSLYEGRAVQAHEELLIFCDCRAGFMYRQNLRRIYSTLSMDTRRNVLAHISAASVPSIRYEPAQEVTP